MRTLEVLAERNEEWLKMAKSFGAKEDDAWELVQGMYEKMGSYVKDVDKIMYNETEVNTFFVFRVLRNLFISGYHITGAKGGIKNNRMLPSSHIMSLTDKEDDNSDESLFSRNPLNKRAKSVIDSLLYCETVDDKGMFDSLYVNIIQDIDNFVDTWYWYDAKLFKLYYDKGMSMRKIAKETGISLKSVFNSLKAAKMKLREEFQEDYNKYKKSLEA
tara:strand:+ start:59 stop:706 length:648 start_codon:yes stop_codon:yes gene_type:complete